MRRDPESGAVVPTYDLSPALMFGDIVQLLAPGPVLLETETAVRTLQSKLAHFDDDDFILCIGDPVAIAAACMVASAINVGRVKLLVFDRHHRSYVMVQVNAHARKGVPA